MFTSRAEYRILLRQDNADLRLTNIGYSLGLASEARYTAMTDKKSQIQTLVATLKKMRVDPDLVNNGLASLNTSPISEKTTIAQLLRRPQIGINDLRNLHPQIKEVIDNYSVEAQHQAEIDLKYESYIQREQLQVEKLGNLEDYKIVQDFDYDRVKALSSEAREKLKRMKPQTVGQASRISGVSPSDVSVLTIYMGK
jgi:tRNA uridine 5-carboxymethylaminomethyl modification enzyme